MRLLVAEVLEKIKGAKTTEEKVKILKQNDSPPMRQILYANFSDKIQFLIPPTPAPFKPSVCPLGVADTNLFRESRRLYLFVKGGHPGLQQARREQLWIQLLEGVAKEEAAVLESLKNKNLERDYNLSADVVLAAYPDLRIPKTSAAPAPAAPVAEFQPVVEDKPKRKRGRPRKVVATVESPLPPTEPPK